MLLKYDGIEIQLLTLGLFSQDLHVQFYSASLHPTSHLAASRLELFYPPYTAVIFGSDSDILLFRLNSSETGFFYEINQFEYLRSKFLHRQLRQRLSK